MIMIEHSLSDIIQDLQDRYSSLINFLITFL